MAIDLTGRRALVTGASGGIGREIATALHGRGATVLLSGRRGDALAGLADELGERSEVLVADLSERDAAAALAERAAPVDVLVANAGIPAAGPLLEFSAAQIDHALDVNLRAPMQLARALAPAMVERGRGHLVFVSSTAGKVATLGSSLYSATKFGLRGFAFGLREDLHGSGVTVTTVFPGFISGAGMFADTGVRLPPGVSARPPSKVAAAVVRGIEANAAEIDVAPFMLRLGGWLAGPAPRLVAALNRRPGRAVAENLARAQREKW